MPTRKSRRHLASPTTGKTVSQATVDATPNLQILRADPLERRVALKRRALDVSADRREGALVVERRRGLGSGRDSAVVVFMEGASMKGCCKCGHVAVVRLQFGRKITFQWVQRFLNTHLLIAA